MIPKPFEGMLKYNQFITFGNKLDSATGKWLKFPTDYRTGGLCSAQDQSVWTDYETAFKAGNGKVGFVLTASDPFWFLDIDSCLTSNTWNELALELCDTLTGCAIEVSMSGAGLHIIGSGEIKDHNCKNTNGIELYHSGRFVAFGGHPGVVGNCEFNALNAINSIVDKYFAKEITANNSTEWGAGPCSAWSGSNDDDELIKRACNSTSAAAVFGSKASFKQLFENDIEALGKFYPIAGRAYDASSADAALAQHLAFWTGNDCQRIERLMRKSALNREKYDNHSSYLTMTINQAVKKQINVYNDKTKIESPAQQSDQKTILNIQDQLEYFKGYCYISDRNSIMDNKGRLENKERFDNTHGGLSFQIDNENMIIKHSAWDAFTRSKAVKFPKVHSSEFRPEFPPGHIWDDGSSILVNNYFPVIMPSKKGDVSPFLRHINKLLPDEHDQALLINYMAAVIQHKGVKFQWCPLIQGVQGNGKTFFSRCLIAAIGNKHTHVPKANEIAEKYNDWLENKIFIAVEDIYVPNEKKEMLEVLKPMITGTEIEIRSMGRDKVTKSICCNFILNSNHKDALSTNRNERRYAIFYTAQQDVADLKRDNMNQLYYQNLYGWAKSEGYAIVNDFLSNYPIEDVLNPALGSRAPITSSTEEAQGQSYSALAQEILNAINEQQQGFRDGWISSHFVDMLITRCGIHNVSRNRRSDVLFELGYVPHTGISKSGHVANPCQPDGCRSKLYIKPDHRFKDLKGVIAAKEYEKANCGHLAD